MDIQDTHRIKLLNAKCEYVCAVDKLSKKLDYGDNIDCCVDKLWLASKLINRLECHCFVETTLNTITTGSEYISAHNLQDTINATYHLYSGTTIIVSYVSVNKTFNFIVQTLLDLSGFSYTSAPHEEVANTTVYTVITKCSLNALSINTDIANFPFIVTSSPVCTTTYNTCDTNCIEDVELDKMYEVLDDLLN